MASDKQGKYFLCSLALVLIVSSSWNQYTQDFLALSGKGICCPSVLNIQKLLMAHVEALQGEPFFLGDKVKVR